MNQNAVVYMNASRPAVRTKKSVCSPTRSKRIRRAEMLAAAFDGICYLALMVCLVVAITVLMVIV